MRVIPIFSQQNNSPLKKCFMIIYRIRNLKEDTPQSQNLTPARAMILAMLYKYRALGEEASEFAAEKLSYFLQRFGEKQLQLEFAEGYYGPYSGKVRHVLYELNGFYLKGYEQKQTQPFEALELVVKNKEVLDTYINTFLKPVERERLLRVSSFIEGFESPYGLELLATVDYVKNKTGTDQPDAIANYIAQWSPRKAQMFSKSHVDLALAHIKSYFP